MAYDAEAKRRVAWELAVEMGIQPFGRLLKAAMREDDTRAWDRVCSYLHAKPKQIDGTLHLKPEFKIEIGGDDAAYSRPLKPADDVVTLDVKNGAH